MRMNQILKRVVIRNRTKPKFCAPLPIQMMKAVVRIQMLEVVLTRAAMIMTVKVAPNRINTPAR